MLLFALAASVKMTGYVCPSCPSDWAKFEPADVLEDLPAAYDTVIFGFALFNGTTLSERFDKWSPGAAWKLDKTVVRNIQAGGRRVLFSAGGATNPGYDCSAWKQPPVLAAFKAEVHRLVDLYGFDGFDIDLEQASRTASGGIDDCTAMYNGLIAAGAGLVVTIAPEASDLRPGQPLKAPANMFDHEWYNTVAVAVNASLNELDHVSVQLYNTDTELAGEAALEQYAQQVVAGYTLAGKGLIQVPAAKLALGFLGSDMSSQGQTGYQPPAALGRIVQKLHAASMDVRVMVWTLADEYASGWAIATAVASPAEVVV